MMHWINHSLIIQVLSSLGLYSALITGDYRNTGNTVFRKIVHMVTWSNGAQITIIKIHPEGFRRNHKLQLGPNY